jgi:hypothetical protein
MAESPTPSLFQRSVASRLREGVWLLLRASEVLQSLRPDDDPLGEHIVNGPEVFRPDMSAVAHQINVSNVVAGNDVFAMGVGNATFDVMIPIYVHYWYIANANVPLEQGAVGAREVIEEIQRIVNRSGNNLGRIADPDGTVTLALNQIIDGKVTITAAPDPNSNMNIWRMTIPFSTRLDKNLQRI